MPHDRELGPGAPLPSLHGTGNRATIGHPTSRGGHDGVLGTCRMSPVAMFQKIVSSGQQILPSILTTFPGEHMGLLLMERALNKHADEIVPTQCLSFLLGGFYLHLRFFYDVVCASDPFQRRILKKQRHGTLVTEIWGQWNTITPLISLVHGGLEY